MPLPPHRHDRALAQLEHCNVGWDTLAATAQDADINSFRCSPTPTAARVALADFNQDASTQRVLRQVFNVTAPCVDIITGSTLGEVFTGRSSTRQWLTALHNGMPKDSWHPDGCQYDPRPPGTDMITILSYPHSEWREEWGGQVEFSSLLCTDSQQDGFDSPVALRLTPSPEILVLFSGPVIHRATHPNGNAPRSRGPKELEDHDENNAPEEGAGWRYSNVMQLTCYNGRFFGPYHERVGPFVMKFRGAQYVVPGLYMAMLVVMVYIVWWQPHAEQSRLQNSTKNL